ncbi:hypothetical protein IHE56_11040 [Streptomyces sp. ID01-12c]|uniref:Uncharacterized protein n=1 Tax=Streptomyces caniscabiei TaxID=2746961 RepID=A0A927L8U7_9ACTN|nr:hypothetical protein [Streptomyces caniscabiei]MBD9702616.1 hypothetical protein [Streptomyces caniscabiei]MBD9727203.1 hypothetical protein [Streptomyces caniscabiei]MDX3512233.1 hypothetical protein [Streptomyces caniscabiei]MDX3721484.1 hypothetical protein [Streptomyces caniscabiei]MDX3727852.1 hypothetical protein [Streptomyces caniscabiei]
MVDAQAKKMWKELMMPVNYFFKNPVAVKLREEGRVEERIAERIASVLRTLDRRHIDVPDAVRRRVRACTDPDILQIWVDRAYDVTDAAELFED